MIRRYVLATAAVVLLVVGLLLGLTVYLGLHYGETSDDRARIGTLAEALTPTADGLQFDPTQTPAQWMQGYAWAMVLDGDGTVIWQYDLPQNLNKHYTASEIAAFSRWYLDDWPVFCWTADYGLFVAAQPRGSVWKYNIYSSAALMYAAAAGLLLPTLGVLLAKRFHGEVVSADSMQIYRGHCGRAGHHCRRRHGGTTHHRLCGRAGRCGQPRQ